MRHFTETVLTLATIIGSIVAIMLLSVDLVNAESRTKFDHFTTGFRLEGTHQFAECESCHNDGVFTGTPTECGDCHTQASRIRATWQPPGHLLTSERCESCHRPVSWSPVVRVDHLEVQGTCSSCHDNNTARGQHPQHIPTSSECDSCHNTLFFRR